MGDVGKWFLQNFWAGLAFGGAIGFILAAILTYLAYRLRKLNDIDDSVLRATIHERQRLLLLCGDAKVLADLAIQRHMNDAAFLRRLHEQACYDTLYPHFSETFRQQIAKEPDNLQRGPTAAIACKEEIEQLEKNLRQNLPEPTIH